MIKEMVKNAEDFTVTGSIVEQKNEKTLNTLDELSNPNNVLTEEEFLSWHKQTLEDKNLGYKIQNLKEFYPLVTTVHNKIIDIIGGISRTFEIDRTKDIGEETPIDTNAFVTPYLSQILEYIPSYFKDNIGEDGKELSNEDFAFSKLKRFGNISSSKHCVDYLIKNFPLEENITDTYSEAYYKSNKYKLYRINNHFSKIGIQWKESMVLADEAIYYITITVDPRAFCLLGYYNGDKGCCFNTCRKYQIGAHTNSIFFIIHKKPEFIYTPSHVDFIGRAFGYLRFSDDKPTINISNGYGKATMNSSGFAMICSELLQIPLEEITMRNNNFTYGPQGHGNGGIPYTSKYAWTFSHKDTKIKKENINWPTTFKHM